MDQKKKKYAFWGNIKQNQFINFFFIYIQTMYMSCFIIIHYYLFELT
jgi:hypothetical protein